MDQNLSVLVGRRLALIRARLQVELDGPPIQDPTWFATSEALAGTLSPAAFTAMPIAIRVGDQATRQDGVVGYFAGDDYATFNAVAPAEAGGGDPYIRPIGPIGGPGGNFLTVTCTDAGTTVSILADPRAAMHAVTGLLPVRRVAIPARFIARPLRAIAVGFRMGPILTAVQQTPAPPTHAPAHAWAVTIPRPAEQHGTWSWWELGAGSGPWTGYDVIPAVANARLGPLPNTLREGTLQLTIDASRDSKSEGD